MLHTDVPISLDTRKKNKNKINGKVSLLFKLSCDCLGSKQQSWITRRILLNESVQSFPFAYILHPTKGHRVMTETSYYIHYMMLKRNRCASFNWIPERSDGLYMRDPLAKKDAMFTFIFTQEDTLMVNVHNNEFHNHCAAFSILALFRRVPNAIPCEKQKIRIRILLHQDIPIWVLILQSLCGVNWISLRDRRKLSSFLCWQSSWICFVLYRPSNNFSFGKILSGTLTTIRCWMYVANLLFERMFIAISSCPSSGFRTFYSLQYIICSVVSIFSLTSINTKKPQLFASNSWLKLFFLCSIQMH